MAEGLAFAPQSLVEMAADSAKPLLRSVASPPRRRRDQALLRDAQRGSTEALEELFRRHWRRAHRAAYLVCGDPVAAEDIAQESFLAAVRALERFDRRRPFGPWLHRIAVNRAIDFARARAARAEQGLAGMPEKPDPGRPRQISDELTAALSGLVPEHRAVIVLRYVLDYTPGEIAQMLGLPRGTVNSRLRRGLDRLRPAIETGGEGPIR